jgi:hypothetical protein
MTDHETRRQRALANERRIQLYLEIREAEERAYPADYHGPLIQFLVWESDTFTEVLGYVIATYRDDGHIDNEAFYPDDGRHVENMLAAIKAVSGPRLFDEPTEEATDREWHVSSVDRVKAAVQAVFSQLADLLEVEAKAAINAAAREVVQVLDDIREGDDFVDESAEEADRE